jgi:hypothetical protein
VVHHLDVAALVDLDCIAGFDQFGLNNVFGGAHVVGVNCSS